MSERGTTNGKRPRVGRPGVLLFPIAGRARAVAVTDTQARRLVKL